MEQYYDIYKFTYRCRDDLDIVVLARTKEIADEIISWWNIDKPKKDQYRPRLFKFKAKKRINIEPYPFEQHQLEASKYFYNRRKKYFEEHGEDKSSTN